MLNLMIYLNVFFLVKIKYLSQRIKIFAYKVKKSQGGNSLGSSSQILAHIKVT